MRNRALFFFLALSLLAMAGCDLSCSSSNNGPTGPIASANITPADPSFHGCPGNGDGGDAILNTFKNRTDEGNYVNVALADLLALTWPEGTQRVSHRNW